MIFVAAAFVAIAITFGGGIDVRRDYRVEVEELRAGGFTGPPANGFAPLDAREQTIVLRGASDVDELDERGGADPAAIARGVAGRRAPSFAPEPLPPTARLTARRALEEDL